MKFNIKGIALFVLLAGTINLFTACSDDEEEPLDQSPTINFIGGSDYTSSDVTVPAGTILKVGITATANTNSNAKLVRFKVTRTFNNIGESVIDSTLSNLSSFTYTRNIQARTEAGTERWSFEIIDKNNQSNSVALNITTQPVVNIYTAILMGGQNNVTVGSFYSSVDNKVMKQAEAILNQNKVDFLYFYGEINQSSIASVDDDQAALAWDNLFDNWSVKNATRFRKVGEINWDAITEYDDALIAENATNLVDSRASFLQVGDIVAFQTATTSANPGKKGLFKVMDISGTIGIDRTITLEVKIQK